MTAITDVTAKIDSLKSAIKHRAKRREREKWIAYSFTKYVKDHKESFELFSYHAYIKNNRSKFHTLVMGLETCPTTNRPHIQGYIFLNEPLTLHGMHVRFPNCHIEPSREGPKANYAYCTKSPDSLKIGNIDEAEFIWDIMKLRGERGVPTQPQTCSVDNGLPV